MILLAIWIAFLMDWLIGDPYTWPHPVKAMGHYINFCLAWQARHPLPAYCFGGFLWLTTVGLSLGLTYLVLSLCQQINPILYWLVWVYLAYSCLATKSLADEAKKVYQALQAKELEPARRQVGMIVGRETGNLSREEISQATIETVAENTSDGVIGPLLCLFLGGPVLAMGYKAVNTLDSMVGYRTKAYQKIGFVSAKMDDVANLIPARLTWFFLCLASFFCRLDWRRAMTIGWRDRYQHASPNSGFSEAVVAGALGIELGGSHLYHGQLVVKPTIGDASRQVVSYDILLAVRLLYISSFFALLVFSVVSRFVGYF